MSGDFCEDPLKEEGFIKIKSGKFIIFTWVVEVNLRSVCEENEISFLGKSPHSVDKKLSLCLETGPGILREVDFILQKGPFIKCNLTGQKCIVGSLNWSIGLLAIFEKNT